MNANVPCDHHYAPQFLLRNFAVDPQRKKVTAVAKHGSRAVWSERSIESIGFERDLYVHLRNGVPVSVETAINEEVETPISKSDTWAKIASGRTDALDKSDKPILYALMRHLEQRTPHALSTMNELAQLAATGKSEIPFTDEERDMYAYIRANPERARAMFAMMSSSVDWAADTFAGCYLSIWRSAIPLRSSTTPVLAIRAPADPALHLPLPGMIPHQTILTLNRNTVAVLALADFDDAFSNIEIADTVAHGLNRHFVTQFAFFENTRHLITDREGLEDDMTWAPYDLVEETDKRIVFIRRDQAPIRATIEA